MALLSVAAALEQGKILKQPQVNIVLLQVRGMMCKMSGVAKVDGEVVCEAEMGAMVRDK